MTGPRIALVGPPEHPGADRARRALAVLLPEAEVLGLPVGTAPTPDLDGLWLLPAPVGSPADVHDTTIAHALGAGLPLVGPAAADDSAPEMLVAAPGGRLALLLGTAPTRLPVQPAGGRPADDYASAAGTVWSAQAHRGGRPAVVAAAGRSPATLTDHALATDDGVHPLLIDFAQAAREHHRQRWAGRQAPFAPPPAPTGGGSLRPLPDDEPRSYVSQMRVRGYHWWRPLVALLLAVGVFFVTSMVLGIILYALRPDLLTTPDAVESMATDPVSMLINNLMLAALIPATLVATRLGHWRPMGALWSVAGRIRWGWLLRAFVVTLVLWGAYLAGSWVLSGESPGDRPEHWQWLVVVTLLTTPLQAAGEEVAFRGGLLQGVGAWIRNPVLALVVGTILSTLLFALAHTSLDPWIIIDLGGMALACCYLTWRTGGLEAAIVLHVVNNLVITVGLSVLGGLQDAYVGTDTTSTGAAAGTSVLATAVMTAVLLLLARRSGIAPKRIGAPARG